MQYLSFISLKNFCNISILISQISVGVNPSPIFSGMDCPPLLFSASYKKIYFKINNNARIYISGVTFLALPVATCKTT